MKNTSLFSHHSEENIFLSFLRLLRVRYTSDFSQRYYEEHPYKNSMYGIKRMLKDYGIANEGLRLEPEYDLHRLPRPFIAHTGSGFVIVTDMDESQVNYLWQGKSITNSSEEFRKTWSGTVLVAETDDNSGEPGYTENRRKEIFEKLVSATFLSIWILLAGLLLFQQQIWQTPGLLLSFLLNVAGIYIGYLLLKKQFHIQSRYGDKICSMFKKSDCNNILESPAAKLFGVISWSEIGLGYFISNILLILFTPQLIPWLALINVCSLPYPVWSVWYQKTKARQWCPLCLAVQIILVLIFVVNLIFGYITLPQISPENLLTLAILYLLPVSFIMLAVPSLQDRDKNKNVVYEMNSLKMKDEVFKATLKSQDYHEVSTLNSQIIWGNPDALIRVTVITNPYCQPCARMHNRLEKLLEVAENKLAIQYIFVAFNDELKKANNLLTTIYLNNIPEQSLEIFKEWYEYGKLHWDEFQQKYAYDTKTEKVLLEIEHHDLWIEQHKITATPTLLINGYVLPDNYKVEDLLYYTDLDI